MSIRSCEIILIYTLLLHTFVNCVAFSFQVEIPLSAFYEVLKTGASVREVQFLDAKFHFMEEMVIMTKNDFSTEPCCVENKLFQLSSALVVGIKSCFSSPRVEFLIHTFQVTIPQARK